MDCSMFSWNVCDRIALLHPGVDITSRSSSIDRLVASIDASLLSLPICLRPSSIVTLRTFRSGDNDAASWISTTVPSGLSTKEMLWLPIWLSLVMVSWLDWRQPPVSKLYLTRAIRRLMRRLPRTNADVRARAPRRVAYSDEKVANRNVKAWFRVGDQAHATPAGFPRHDCSLHVRRECLGFVPRSRTIFCRP
jgi:hypothetical protein